MTKKQQVADAAPAKAPAPSSQQAPPQPQQAPASPAKAADPPGKDFSETPAQASPPVTNDTDAQGAAPAPLAPLAPVTPMGLSPRPQYDPFKLSADPPSLIDWSAMRKPFLNRGVPLDGAGIGMIETNWMFTYNQMFRLGFSADRAASIANFGTPLAYDFSLQRDAPTLFEESDKQIEKMMPAGKKLGTITVPIITPDTLGWVAEKLTGKTYDFRF